MNKKVLITTDDTKEALELLGNIVAFDIETSASEPNKTALDYMTQELDGVSLCDGNNCFYIDYSITNNPEIIKLLKQYFSRVKIAIAHNITFDMLGLYKHGITLEHCELFDTMVAHHLIDEESRHGLKHLAEHFLDAHTSSYEEESKLGVHTTKFYEYALNDSLWTFKLANIFRDILKNQGLDKLFREIEMPFQHCLVDMKVNGISVDRDKIDKSAKELKKLIEDLTVKMLNVLEVPYDLQIDLYGNSKVDSKINFNSSKALIEIIQNKLKLTIKEKTPAGNPSVGKQTISDLKDKHPFMGLLYDYKIASKLLSGFFLPLPEFIDKEDGRIRPSFRDTGTKTGRLSCIAEGTKIQVIRDFSKEPNGRNIEDINPGDFVYCSTSDGRLVHRKVKRIINNGKQECVMLKWKSLSNKFDGELVLTPDHKIKTMDGKWTRADEVGLTSDSEIGYKRRMGEDISLNKRAFSLHFQLNDYAYIYYPGMKKVKNIRHLMNAPNIPYKSHIHHKDGNKLNDSIENLIIMTPTEHSSYHCKNGTGFTEESQKKAQKTLRDMRIGGEFKKTQPLKHFSYDYCSKIAHDNKGMIKYIIKNCNHDFVTISREMKRHNINLKEIKKLYEETNHYFVNREYVGERQVYDLEIESYGFEDTHNFFANEICVHNCNKPNLQQLSKSKEGFPVLRECFVASPGYKMAAIDYSGQEIRVMAELSKDPTLVDALHKGQDMHLKIANQFYNLGIPDECLYTTHTMYAEYKSKFNKQRSMAKAITFGLSYGKGAYGFAKDFNTTEDEAQKIVDKYFEGMPKLKEAIEKAQEDVKENGFVSTMTGRRRRFTPFEIQGAKIYSKKNLRQAFNFQIQGYSADMMRIACIHTKKLINLHPEWDMRMLMTVHDELVVECKESFIEEACVELKSVFEEAVKFCVPIVADICYGQNYEEVK